MKEQTKVDQRFQKGLDLHKKSKLTWKDWLKEFKEFRDSDMTQKQFEELVRSVYVATKPENWLHYCLFCRCDELLKEGKSVREIAKIVNLPKSNVYRMLTSEKNIQTIEDIAFFVGESVSTVKRVIRERKGKS